MPLKSSFPDIELREPGNLAQFILDDAAVRDPESTVMVNPDTGERRTLRGLREDIDRLTKALHAHGVRKGDVVAMCLPNCMEYIPLALAVILRGGIFCGLNPAYTVDEYEYHLADCTAKLVFASPESIKNVARAAAKVDNRKVVLIEHGPDHGEKSSNVITYKSFLTSGDSVGRLPDVPINSRTDPACMLYSSGTTGRPKGVLLSHYSFAGAMQILYAPSIYDSPKEGEYLVGMLPMFHIMGAMVSISSIRVGSVLLVVRKYEWAKFLSLVQEYKVRMLYCVPPIMVSLAKDPLVDKYDLSSIRTILVGAAPVGKELHDEVMSRLPKMELLCQAYGMTEGSCGSMMTPKWKAKAGSCGKLVPNFSCKVVDLETGVECGAHQHGEIWVKSETLMLGYFHNPKATAETIDKDGWLHTGDIGYYDEEGYFYIVDRLKELIKVKAFQVSPAELEDLLISHPDVDDAAVIAKPDPISGEVPKAIVVKKPSAKVTDRELMKFVEDHVASFKRLRGGVEFVDQIPKSASGKILRRILQQREREMHAKGNVSKM